MRLRLINASNARNLALDFADLAHTVIAINGRPVTTHVPDKPIVIGAAGRVDLILDMMAKPGSAIQVTDHFYQEPIDLTRFVYTTGFCGRQPGKWLFHCHALKHHAAGLGALVRIA